MCVCVCIHRRKANIDEELAAKSFKEEKTAFILQDTFIGQFNCRKIDFRAWL